MDREPTVRGKRRDSEREEGRERERDKEIHRVGKWMDRWTRRERQREAIVVSDEHTPVGSDIATENKVALGDTAAVSRSESADSRRMKYFFNERICKFTTICNYLSLHFLPLCHFDTKRQIRWKTRGTNEDL